MRHYLAILLLFCVIALPPLMAQFRRIDSLKLFLIGTTGKQRIDVMNAMAAQYWRVSPDSGIAYSMRAYQEAEEIKYDHGKAQALNSEGASYYVKGFYARSLELHFRALTLAESLRDTAESAIALRRIGNVYADQNNQPKAREFYQQALQYLKTGIDEDARASVLNNIGASYLFQHNYNAALEYLYQGLNVAQQIQSASALSVVYTTLGETYLAQGVADQALEYFSKAYITNQIEGELDTRAYLQIHIGKALLLQKKYAEAVKSAQDGLRLSRSIESRNTMSIGYQTLASIYAAQRDTGMAFRYQKAYSDLRDSVMSADGISRIQQLQSEYEIEAKNREILLLQSAQDLSTLWRNSLLAGLVGMAIVIILVVNRIRIKRRAEDILQAKNDELAAKAKQLEEVNNEKNEFLGIVAHDLKNPLSNIKGIAALLEDPDSITKEEVVEFAGIIRETSEKMFELIQNLLDVNRIDRGGLAFTIAPFLPAMIVQRVVNDYTRRAEQKAIALHFDSTFPPDYFALADDKSYLQIVENILSNAIKYSPYGKNIFVRLHMYEQKARLEIRDEGPGMTPEDLAKLFGKFARLSAQPTGGEHSTGLGLSIVKKLVEAMNGSIWCESEYGHGAVFIVEFPTVSEHDLQI